MGSTVRRARQFTRVSNAPMGNSTGARRTPQTAIIMTGPRDVTVHWQRIIDSHQTEASLSLTSGVENQTARRTQYAIKAQRFHIFRSFPQGRKNILLPSGAYIIRVPGAPSPKGQPRARVNTRTNESLGCSLNPTQDKQNTRQDHTALRVPGAPSPQELKTAFE